MEDDSDQDARTVFCANLSPKATEELIYELFLQAGPVERVKIPLVGGRPANYAFITFKHVCTVEYAMEIFRDTELFGNYIRLKKRNVRNQENYTQNRNAQNEKSDKNDNRQDYNAILQAQNMVHMTNMNYMMTQGYPLNNMYLGQNCYMQPQQRRSPPRNRYPEQRPSHTPSGRYDSRSRDHRRYDDHKPRHNERRDHKRHKRN